MKHLHLIVVALMLLPLISCQTFDDLAYDLEDAMNGNVRTPSTIPTNRTEQLLASPCPRVELVDDLSSISDFTSPAAPKPDELISRVDLHSAQSTCKLSANSAIVDLKIIFNGRLGARGKQKPTDKPFFTYPFFVAVTAPNGKIMAKEIFAASLSYDANENTHSYFENLRQIIPIKSKEQAVGYKILIGFQLSPDQLAYNRANMIPVTPAKKAAHP